MTSSVSVPLPRLVFAVDATASRQDAWDAARQTTDALFTALPGKLEVALAVHGGGVMHTFTDFETDLSYHRAFMAEVECRGGATRIGDMLMRTLASANVRVCAYVGDHIEDDPVDLIELAEECGRKKIKIIILHDRSGEEAWHRYNADSAAQTFSVMARLSGGAVLPFDPKSIGMLREMLAAVAVLAGEGKTGLATNRKKLKAADNLLRLLPP